MHLGGRCVKSSVATIIRIFEFLRILFSKIRFEFNMHGSNIRSFEHNARFAAGQRESDNCAHDPLTANLSVLLVRTPGHTIDMSCMHVNRSIGRGLRGCGQQQY